MTWLKHSYVSSVDFSCVFKFRVGDGKGNVELWDVETGQKLLYNGNLLLFLGTNMF